VNQPRLSFNIILLTILIGGLALAACGGDDDEDRLPPSRLVTIQPQPEATVLPGCETGDLESWYEVAGTLVNRFGQESMAALNLEPDKVISVVERLIDLREAIAAQPTPECALSVHGEILIRINGMLTSFQRYANGDITQDELRQQIEEANLQIETDIATLLATKQKELEERLRQQRATQTAPSD
jgi:hypothetical protein